MDRERGNERERAGESPRSSTPGPSLKYPDRKQFYRDSYVAGTYDAHRFESRKRKRRNARKWRTIVRALAHTEDVQSVLDLPCGTGRFTGKLAELGKTVVASDISMEMMAVAHQAEERVDGILGYVQADSENLSIADDAVDCIVSIRFVQHLDPAARRAIFREFARVTRRWVIIDFRVQHSFRYWSTRVRRAVRLTQRSLPQLSRRTIEEDLEQAGMRVRAIVPVARYFSDKWIVVCELAHFA